MKNGAGFVGYLFRISAIFGHDQYFSIRVGESVQLPAFCVLFWGFLSFFFGGGRWLSTFYFLLLVGEMQKIPCCDDYRYENSISRMSFLHRKSVGHTFTSVQQ